MRQIIVLLLTICLCLGQIAVAFPAVNAEKPRHTPPIPIWEQVGHRVLMQVNWDWRPALEGWCIQFGPGRPGRTGLTDKKARLITIWVRTAGSPESVVGTIVHELAHAFDYQYLTPELRAKWIAARGLPPDTPWYRPMGSLSTDYFSGAGDFAESVAWTLQGSKVGFRSCLGMSLNDKQKKSIARGCRGLLPTKVQQALIRQWLTDLPRTGGK